MARLPIPGGDDNVWGQVLNDFLAVEHNSDGSLRTNGTLSQKANDNSVVHIAGAETITGSKTFGTSPIVPTPTSANQAATKNYVDTVAVQGAADATTGTKGIVQLTGDLAGTAASPTVPGLATKQPLDADLTTIAALAPTDDMILQRKAGAWSARTPAQLKTDLAITKADVGLANVDNTSDVTKNSAAATLTNKTISGAANTITNIAQSSVTNLATDLAAKAADNSVVHLAGTETISGAKTFSSTVVVPTPSSGPEAATRDYVDTAVSTAGAGNTVTIIYDTTNLAWPSRPSTSSVPAGCVIYVSEASVTAPTDMQLYDTWRKI